VLMTRPVLLGVSLKMYFGVTAGHEWLDRVVEVAREHPAISDGRVRLVVIPSFVQIPGALDRCSGTRVLVGAQDVAATDLGPFTGEVAAAELAEVGVSHVEIGHAERRRLFGEDDEAVAAKVAIAIRHGVTPVLCLGEEDRLDARAAAQRTLVQLRSALSSAPAGPLVIAYEPVWAIGAAEPASVEHITAVVDALATALAADPDRAGSAVIYGGSAGPGLLTRLGDAVDGLFLGRFAHDPEALRFVIDEAAALADDRARGTA
jgi:triosephosphate isomerase (TIM)